MLLKVLVVGLCAGLTALNAQEAAPLYRLVNTTQGPVRGQRHLNTDVFAFYGIPYATGPTGPDRFKAPQPPPTWTETFEATNGAIRCPQNLNTAIPEDCLVANVFIPDTQETDLPVMVNVHGGAFQVGFGNSAVPISIVSTNKLIVVTFNYRVGVHGFLCLGTEEVPGNAGMKDQVALLRWVQANIAKFGGNSDDVTISGCSAGGASVDLLRVSNITTGLFHKVIGGSGGNAGSFGIQSDPTANAKYYASMLNFENVDNLTALVEFYTQAPLSLLFSRNDIVVNRPDSSVLFTPCVERDIDGVESFLHDAPVNIIKKGEHPQYPMLYGFAEMEGLMRITLFESWRHRMNANFSDFLPVDLEFSNDTEKEAVAARAKEFYFKDGEVDESTILTYINYFTDVLFGYSMLRSVRLNAEHGSSSMFLYEYSFTDTNTSVIPHTEGARGATHCDQHVAVFDENEEDLTPEYLAMKEVMRKLYLDFITTGSPVSEGSTLAVWGPADGNRSPHMNLDSNSTLRGPLLEERAQFWDELYGAHYRTPIAPIVPAESDEPSSATSLATISSLWLVYSVLISVANRF